MDPLNVTIVVLLFAAVAAIEWIDRRDLAAKWFRSMRVRMGRQLPVGWHEAVGEIGFSFGSDDADLVLGITLQGADQPGPTRYVARTDSETRFTVAEDDVDPDTLLAAYDDEVGPVRLHVDRPGHIAQIQIAPRD